MLTTTSLTKPSTPVTLTKPHPTQPHIHSKHHSTSLSTVIMCWAIVIWACGHTEEFRYHCCELFPASCPNDTLYDKDTENRCTSCEPRRLYIRCYGAEDGEFCSKKEPSSKGEEKK